MTREQLGAIHELRSEGFSLREIATELDLPKSTVERACKSIQGEPSATPAPPAPMAYAPDAMPGELRQTAAQTYQLQQQEDERVAKRQDWFVSKVNRLIKEVIANGRKTTWDEGDMDDFLLRSETLKEKLLAFCDRCAIDEEDLKIWFALDGLIDLVARSKEEGSGFFSGSEIEFNLSKKAIARWKELLIDDFTDEAPQDGDDEDDEDSDDDEEED